MSPTGVDQSWGFSDPAQDKAAGVQVVSMYLSRDPSKNATAAKIKAYHDVGIAVWLNFEDSATAPLGGAAQGAADVQVALQLVRSLIQQLGYAPRNRMAIPFSADFDAQPAQYPVIDAYYGATKQGLHAAGDQFANACYGKADLIEHLHAAGLTEAEWETLAWSNGRISTEADFYQSSINDTLGGASVDFDTVLHITQMGAWWPPNSPYNVSPNQPAPVPVRPKDDDMAYPYVVRADKAKGGNGAAILVLDPHTTKAIHGADSLGGYSAAGFQLANVNQVEFNSYPAPAAPAAASVPEPQEPTS